MSIINDALKKTQLSRKVDKDKQEQAPPSPTLQAQPIKKSGPGKKVDLLFTWKMASLLTLTAMLAMMAFQNYQRKKEVKPPVVQAVSKPVNKFKVAFEGVFHSAHAKIALINKQQLHVGDAVNGMKIIAINEDAIDLQGDNGIIQLRAGASYLL